LTYALGRGLEYYDAPVVRKERAAGPEGRELRHAARAQPRLVPQFLPTRRPLAVHGGAPC